MHVCMEIVKLQSLVIDVIVSMVGRDINVKKILMNVSQINVLTVEVASTWYIFKLLK